MAETSLVAGAPASGDVPALARRDPELRELRQLYMGIAEPSSTTVEEEPPALVPALMAGYLDMRFIRHAWPVVLRDSEAEPVIDPLAVIVDRAVAAHAADNVSEPLRRDALRLEAGIRALGEDDPGRDLASLWRRAEARLVEAEPDDGRRTALAERLEALSPGRPPDGILLDFSTGAAEAILQHAWARTRRRIAVHDREILEELMGQVAEVLDAERAQAPESSAPDALREAMAGAHAGGIDFDALSSLLQATGRFRPPAPRRMRRLGGALKVIEAEHRRLAEVASGDGRTGSSGRASAPVRSCREVLDTWRREVARWVDLARAVRIATLELENRYREDRHDAHFAAFGAGHLAAEERGELPPLLVLLDSERVDAAERAALLELLASDIPIKIGLAVRQIPGNLLLEGEPRQAGDAGETGEWPERLASMALLLDNAFVLQSAASHLPDLAAQIEAGFRHPGPALFAIYTSLDTPDSGVPAYLRCAAAVESRAFPTFVCDPGRGSSWASRLSLAGNPQPDRAWPEHALAYEDGDGRLVEERLAFTAVDFLALDVRFRSRLPLIPGGRAPERLLPPAEYLARPGAPESETVPCVYLVDAQGRLHRAVVRRELLAYAERVAGHWQRLSGMAIPAQPSATAGEGRGGAALPSETAAAGEAASAGEPAAAVATVAGADAAAVVATLAPGVDGAAGAPATPPAAGAVAAGPGGDLPSIDTALCTTCNECTVRNPQMFAYNAAKQAYIRDPRAGTYRELVETAENCPVCIIHPGKPLDPNEPGLEDLIRRAAALA